MTDGVSLDNLIRSTLREEVAGQEPSAAVRDALLKEAARRQSLQSAVGPSIPALTDGLHDSARTRPTPSNDRILALSFYNGQWLLFTAPLYAVR
jgi:hypothetical protein